MAKIVDSHIRALGTSIALARDVLRECADTKTCEAVQAWVFALLAKITSSALSAQTLLNGRHVLDAKLVVRAMLDAVVDLHYIVNDPLREKNLLELLELEIAEDRYRELDFLAEYHGQSLEQFARHTPGARDIIDAYECAKRHKAFRNPPKGTPKRRWPKRWRALKPEEKMRGLEFKKVWKRSLWFTITRLGDASAHSRYLSLRHLMEQEGENAVRFVLRPKSAGLLAPGWIAFEATLCLVVACDTIIDKYYLSPALVRRVERLVARLSRLAKLAKAKGGKDAGPRPARRARPSRSHRLATGATAR